LYSNPYTFYCGREYLQVNSVRRLILSFKPLYILLWSGIQYRDGHDGKIKERFQTPIHFTVVGNNGLTTQSKITQKERFKPLYILLWSGIDSTTISNIKQKDVFQTPIHFTVVGNKDDAPVKQVYGGSSFKPLYILLWSGIVYKRLKKGRCRRCFKPLYILLWSGILLNLFLQRNVICFKPLYILLWSGIKIRWI